MPDRSRRTHLRESTAEAHASLDLIIGPFDTANSYIAYLRGVFAFREAVEGALSAAVWPDDLRAWHPQNLSGLVAADLSDLDIYSQLPIDPPDVPRHAEEFMGVLYVLEGSALGARLLYKRAQALGFGADFGARHLALQSKRNDRWPTFLALLEDAKCIDMVKVSSASRATFQLAEKAFRQVAHEPA